MSEDVTIRPAEREDRDAVWPLARDFATSYRLDQACFNSTFPSLLSRRDTLLIVAESDHGIIGYLLASCRATFLANGPVAWVEELMVAASTRRLGVGRKLMHTAERWSADNQAAYLALATRRAGEFYRSLDYRESAVYFKKTLESG